MQPPIAEPPALLRQLAQPRPQVAIICPARTISHVTCSPEIMPLVSWLVRWRRAMRRGRFTEDQIIGVLREHEAGVKTADLCRKHGISDATFYNWKAKYGGMTVSEAARLRTLEDENRRLKKLLAESMLDVSALKDLLGKN
jgi:putative transposase